MTRRTYSWLAKAAPAGGKARMRRLTREERQALAQEAARARWKRTTKVERQEAARKAVRARWARERAKTKAKER